MSRSTDEDRLTARQDRVVAAGNQRVSTGAHLQEMEGTDTVGLTRIGKRSLFSYQRRTPLALTPGTDDLHCFLLRSDTQYSARPAPFTSIQPNPRFFCTKTIDSFTSNQSGLYPPLQAGRIETDTIDSRTARSLMIHRQHRPRPSAAIDRFEFPMVGWRPNSPLAERGL